MDISKVYNSIDCLNDVRKYVFNLSDGEACFLELKEVSCDICNQKNRQASADFKLDIAKEVSAFSNTAGGIVAVGIRNIGEGIVVANEANNLYGWIDKNVSSFIEPINRKIEFKLCDDDEGQFVVMLVPSGCDIPYRVSSVKHADGVKRKDVIRQYYQRIGTNSVPIPEPIVRYMYKSTLRQIHFEAYSDIKYIGKSDDGLRDVINICQLAKPDEVRFIDGWSYYVDSEIFLLSDAGQVLNNDRICLDNSSIGSIRALPPSKKEVVLDALEVRTAVGDGYFADTLDIIGGQTETRSPEEFLNTYGVYIETRYATDGLPLTLDKRLFIVGKNKNIGKVAMKEISDEQIDCANDVKIMSYTDLTDVDVGFVKKALMNIVSMDERLVL